MLILILLIARLGTGSPRGCMLSPCSLCSVHPRLHSHPPLQYHHTRMRSRGCLCGVVQTNLSLKNNKTKEPLLTSGDIKQNLPLKEQLLVSYCVCYAGCSVAENLAEGGKYGRDNHPLPSAFTGRNIQVPVSFQEQENKKRQFPTC